jgi:tRNA(Ile)-lysidine synthase
VLNRVSGTLSRYSMCSPGQHVAVAVSGGADSVCLLYLLRELAPSLGITLSVAHLNHKLRGAESDADAAFVKNLAENFGLPFHYKEVEVSAAAGNLEQAGRNARLQFFDTFHADRIATGHTQSDQAETVLYRLLRGSGTAGLAGVLPVVGRRIRPLIDCTREQVREYLASFRIPWREDATNSDTSYARNYIRHHIVPVLPEGVAAVLARTAELARDEEEYWTSEIDRLAGRYLKSKAKAVLINADDLSTLPVAVQRRLLRRAVQKVKGDLRQIDLFHVDALLRLAGQREGHGRTQAPGVDVFRSFEWLRFAKPRTESRAERDYCLGLAVPGTTPIPGQASIVCVEVAENTEYAGSDREYNMNGDLLDVNRLSNPLELRNWRPGDHFTRTGHSSEKVKTLFQLSRIPIWERQGWPVITSGDRIVWTRGFGVSSEYVPARDSSRILRIVEQETDSAESNTLDSASLY